MYTEKKLVSLLLVYFSHRYVNKIQTAPQPQRPSPHTPPPSFLFASRRAIFVLPVTMGLGLRVQGRRACKLVDYEEYLWHVH